MIKELQLTKIKSEADLDQSNVSRFQSWLQKLRQMGQYELAESRENAWSKTMAKALCDKSADDLAWGIMDEIELIKEREFKL